MTRPTQFNAPLPGGWSSTGGDPALPDGQPTTDCCDDETTLPDRALDQVVFVGVLDGDGTLVQSDSATDGGGGSSLAYPSDTTAGNLLVAVLVARGGVTTPSTPSGWTAIDNAGKSNPHEVTMFWRVAPGGPVTVAFVAPTDEVRIYLMEFEGGGAGLATTPTTHDGGASVSSFPVPSLTVSGPSLLVGVVDAGDGVPNTITFTEDSDFTNVDQGQVGGSLNPESIVGYRVVSAGTYDYNPTGNHNSSGWGGVLAAFDLGEGWVGGGPNITDGDDATYQEIPSGNVVRIDLGAEFEIARIRVRLGTETAGARTYILKGANEADFSDAVTVATLNFTATGSFTAQDVTDSWAATDAYRFWELTGDDETRRVYSFELYEAANADAAAVAADLEDHIDDTTDAHDASAVSVDTSGFTNSTGDDVQEVLADLDAAISASDEPVEVVAISGSAVTIDYDVARHWDITLTDDCTLTIVNPPDDQTWGELVVILRQGGAGSFTVTWPAAVQWPDADGLPGGSAPTLNTAVGAQDVVTLTSVDGGITWGGSTGAAALSFATPAIVLGTAAAAGAAASVIRSDATIAAFDATVPVTQAYGDAAATGAAAVAARRDHVHGMPASPITDHEHIVNVVFSGDGATTVWELPAAPVSDTGVAVYVTGSRSIAWALSGTLLTTLTFDAAPASAANNIVIDIVAATS